jgi:hypothetical protein
MSIKEVLTLKEPLPAEKMSMREKVRQLLSFIMSPQDDSLRIFRQTRTTYLTPFPI